MSINFAKINQGENVNTHAILYTHGRAYIKNFIIKA